MPILYVDVLGLAYFPKFNVEEINEVAIVERLRRLENKMFSMSNMVNENCDEIGSIKQHVASTQHDLRTHCDVHKLRNNHGVRDEGAVSGGGAVPDSNSTGIRTTDGTTVNDDNGNAKSGGGNGVVMPSLGMPVIVRNLEMVVMPNQPKSGPRNYHVNSKSISGKSSNSRIKAGPEPNCEVYIAGIDNESHTPHDLRSFLESCDIRVKKLVRLSMEQRSRASYLLVVPVSDEIKVYDDELWPSGINVRPFTRH